MSAFLRNIWEHKDEDAIFREFEGVATGLWPDEQGIDPDGFLQFFRALSPFFRDVRLDFVQWHESEDALWLRWWVRCKHGKKSEKLVALPCAASCKFHNGKLVECNNFQDMLLLFSQLDLVPEQAFEYGLAGMDILEEEERRKEALSPSQKGQSHFLWPGLKKVRHGGRDLYLPATAREVEGEENLVLPDEEQLEVLFQSAAFSMAVVDSDDVILEADGALAEMMGCPKEELEGRIFFQLLAAEDREKEQELFCGLIEGKKAHYYHRASLAAGEATVAVSLAVARLSGSGDSARILRAVQPVRSLEELVGYQESRRNTMSQRLRKKTARDLASLWLYLQTGRRQAEPQPELLERCSAIVERMSTELRLYMKELRSPVLEGVPLPDALQELIRGAAATSDIDFQCSLSPGLDELSFTLSMLGYRVVQEAVRNVTAHSRASKCRIDLWVEGVSLQGEISDDGVGFDPTTRDEPEQLGLLGMKERCELVGGTFSVESGPGEGTRVSFSLGFQRGERS